MLNDIENLVQGYRRFRKHYFSEQNSAFEDLVRLGQRPKVLMIACSDSRVDPAIVMDCQPGDLFVIRNVANLVPPFEDDQSYHGTSAALQFGICGLGIRHVILFGHTQCGGIQALLEQAPETCEQKGFIAKWMELAKPAHEAVLKYHKEATLDEKNTLCGQYSLINSLRNLQTFPWIIERVTGGSLFLHAWNFDLVQGVIEVFDEKENCFKKLKEKNDFQGS
ncbi:MAG: carbonic anhydrase [Alphaproteobacteria bacterium]|nr:carbonic anhydrase [Alphaproteobacteria bacterium]